MSTFKKCKVVMLPTKEKAELQKFGISLRYKFNRVNSMVGEYQHLYIISDDEIKVDLDTCINYMKLNKEHSNLFKELNSLTEVMISIEETIN